MTPTEPLKKVKMTAGKFRHLQALSNSQGIIAAAAVDMRKPLRIALSQARGTEISDTEFGEFKAVVAERLAPYTSAILLDTEYALPALAGQLPPTGLLLAYEKSGYDTSVKGRLPDLLPEWSVKRLLEAGANGIKILLYYDKDDSPLTNSIKQAYIERVGAECRAWDVPFFLEPITYSDEIGDEKSLAFARVKPAKVIGAIVEFTRPRYGVDILKVEVPVNPRFVEGSKANLDRQVAYSREETLQYFRDASAAATIPFIYLSAGVSDEVFRESLQTAAQSGVHFAGVLCGRATWQGGIAAYGQGGATALRNWLDSRGVENIKALNQVLTECAKPWWDYYGGKTNIEIVDSPY